MNDERQFSGRFLLRVEPGLHAALRVAADAMELSLNEYCVRKLGSPNMAIDKEAAAAVQAAAAIAGESLVGVVVFGSWARGEEGPDSDVDLLIVLDQDASMGRDLYRRWDCERHRWEGHEVEPHFVRLPPDDRRLLGTWAEAAIDGIVLFERSLRVSRRLAKVRHDIAAGRIQRRFVRDRPYWVEAA